MDPVPAARKQGQRRPRFRFGLRLGQDPPAGGDDRVGGEDEAAGLRDGRAFSAAIRQA
jgi:hypothetical protein